MSDALLSVRGLSVSLATESKTIRAVDDVSFDVRRGEVLALVGESGAGKSVTAFAIMQILDAENARMTGSIALAGRELVGLKEKELCKIRGGSIGIVFQEPMTALNPIYTVGAQIVEAIRLHRPLSRSAAKEKAIEWMARMKMPEPKQRFSSYPHELSGGMRQRVLLAMALAPEPSLLILDEPTTALDRTVEAEILDVLLSLKKERDLSMLLITHDFAIVSEVADRTMVMYAGEVVEEGATEVLLSDPKHPYSRALIDVIPTTGRRPPREIGDSPRPLPVIPGSVPEIVEPPQACRFLSRCDDRIKRCAESAIPLVELGTAKSRCILSIPAPPVSKRTLVLAKEPTLELGGDDD